jgi:ribosomal protein L11 methyltransferase
VTLALTIVLPDDYHELLMAELADLGFEAFEEAGHGQFVAYGPLRVWGDVPREQVESWLAHRGLPVQMTEATVEEQNWNAQWEATIRPLVVGDFVVRPTWSDKADEHDGKIELLIDPKMSFGTGHHESTRLVLRLLPPHVSEGAAVLDAGCGTGVLAVAALKLGAAHALGFDIDPWAERNAIENAELNDVGDRFEVREGSLEVVPETGFDLCLANINLNAHRELVPGLVERLTPGAPLIMAGLLRTDHEAIAEILARSGYRITEKAVENEWMALVAHRA